MIGGSLARANKHEGEQEQERRNKEVMWKRHCGKEHGKYTVFISFVINQYKMVLRIAQKNV